MPPRFNKPVKAQVQKLQTAVRDPKPSATVVTNRDKDAWLFGLPGVSASRLSLGGAIKICVLASFLAHCACMPGGDLVLDDTAAIGTNDDIRSRSVGELIWPARILKNDFWGQPMTGRYSHHSYRPLVVATYKYTYVFAQESPRLYLIGNVFWHCSTTALFTYTARFLLSSNAWATVAGLLFAVTPVHVEAVASIVGRAETMSAFFYLLAFVCYRKAHDTTSVGWWEFGQVASVRRHYESRHSWSADDRHSWLWFAASVLVALLALFSKEPGITCMGLFGAYDVIMYLALRARGFRPSFQLAAGRFLLLTALSAAILVFRLWLQNFDQPPFSHRENPLLAEGIEHTVYYWLNAAYIWPMVVRLLVWPESVCDYTAWYSLITSQADPRNLVSLVCVAGIVLSVLYAFWRTTRAPTAAEADADALREQEALALGADELKRLNAHVVPTHEPPTAVAFLLAAVIFIVSYLPGSHIFLRVGFFLAERGLFLSSQGFFVLCAMLLRHVYNTHVLAVQDNDQALAKRNRTVLAALFWTVVACYTYRTVWYSQTWLDEKAVFDRGYQKHPWSPFFLRAKASRMAENKATQEASLALFERAAELMPDTPQTYVGWCFALTEIGDSKLPDTAAAEEWYAKAEVQCRMALQVYPASIDGMRNFVALMDKREDKQYEEQERMLNEHLEFHPRSHNSLFALANVYYRTDRHDLAIETYERCIAASPGFAACYNSAGAVQHGRGLKDEAAKYWQKAVDLGLQDVSIQGNLGVLAYDKGDYEEARKYFAAAHQLNPNDQTHKNNLAAAENAIAIKRQEKQAEMAAKRARRQGRPVPGEEGQTIEATATIGGDEADADASAGAGAEEAADEVIDINLTDKQEL